MIEYKNMEETAVYDTGRGGFDSEILSNIELSDYADIIEVGCGNGRFLKELIKAYPTAAVTGLDASPYGIDDCKEEIKGDFICADILRYEPRRQYDAVMCFNTIEHFQNKHIIIHKLKELLRPGGFLILTVPNAEMDLCENHYNFWNVHTFEKFLEYQILVTQCFLIDDNQNILLTGYKR